MARLAAASAHAVLPDVLQPVDRFVALAGEEFRKRLFMTEGPDGEPLCLRPDFTIPVCLEHLRLGPKAPTVYRYRGKIFRKQRMIGEPEFEQAGTEWIGHSDEIATDAAVFALASECAAAVDLSPKVRVGDAHVFAALIEALDLPPSWRERLKGAFGDGNRLHATITRLTARRAAGTLAARLAPALAQLHPDDARAVVDAVVGGRKTSAPGRSSDDIAARILEEASGHDARPEMMDAIVRFVAIEAPLAAAPDALAAFARREGVDLSGAIENFASRLSALENNGIDTAGMRFEASFGRRLNYYTGFVFEMVDPAEPRAEVIAGGRYDRLMALLHPGKPLPAIGFSVWLDRLPRMA
ncbi:MAG: ATP phosphoribosyltransferase regulatory subunit [Pseudomonadota bacterium]